MNKEKIVFLGASNTLLSTLHLNPRFIEKHIQIHTLKEVLNRQQRRVNERKINKELNEIVKDITNGR